MKKTIVILMLAVMVCVSTIACAWNYNFFDTTWSFTRAIISLPDGTIVEGKVQTWKDFEEGDQIQVKVDDVTYLVHSNNIALMAE